MSSSKAGIFIFFRFRIDIRYFSTRDSVNSFFSIGTTLSGLSFTATPYNFQQHWWSSISISHYGCKLLISNSSGPATCIDIGIIVCQQNPELVTNTRPVIECWSWRRRKESRINFGSSSIYNCIILLALYLFQSLFEECRSTKTRIVEFPISWRSLPSRTVLLLASS